MSSIARLLGVSRTTLYKYVPEAAGRARAIEESVGWLGPAGNSDQLPLVMIGVTRSHPGQGPLGRRWAVRGRTSPAHGVRGRPRAGQQQP